MITFVKLPKSAMGIQEGTILKWRVAVGATIARGQVLVEVESVKAVVEVQAPIAGQLRQILVAEGQTVPVNSVLATIDTGSPRNT